MSLGILPPTFVVNVLMP